MFNLPGNPGVPGNPGEPGDPGIPKNINDFVLKHI